MADEWILGYEITHTNSPILLTGNTVDAFTSSAFKMAGFFTGSHVLLQDGVGVSTLPIDDIVAETDMLAAWDPRNPIYMHVFARHTLRRDRTTAAE